MKPLQPNATFRLLLIAERCDPELLDDPKSFDNVLGRGRFSALHRGALNEARRIVKDHR